MSRKTGWRIASLIALAAWVCTVWIPLPRGSAPLPPALAPRPMLDATVLVAALPPVLTPPPVASGWRLVSMIAEDIDRDGDLDVVANDGTVDLVVWTNDGTGHLTRQPGRTTSGWRADASGPALANRPLPSGVVVQTSPFSHQPGPRIGGGRPVQSPYSREASAGALRPAFVSLWIPRGPPPSFPLI